MARLGILKPLQGTASSLANIILEEGEIAFDKLPSGEYGDYGIKMGDGVTVYSNLPYFIKRTKEESWEYDDGTDEAALLNNIKHPELETIGKIYYIQSYMNSGSQGTEGTPTIQQEIPYMVIGINHDGTSNTMDLMSCVAVNYLKFNNSANNYTYGKYSTSKLYNWLPNTCVGGYSANIQDKMVYMTERWREASGNRSGTLQTRSTKVKLLNPLELFGSSIASYNGGLSTVSDFTQYDYGSHYSGVFPNSITADTSRLRYHDKAMSNTCTVWTNSWYAYDTSYIYARCFDLYDNGSCRDYTVNAAFGVAPVLRLSAGYTDWTYDDGNDETALLNNIKHPEFEQLGKIYYIQSYMNAGTERTEGTPTIEQNIPYKVIGINHEGTTNTVDLQAMVAVNYIVWNYMHDGWTYGKYTTSRLYNWIGTTCQNGYSANIQAKMVTMTERWREATGIAKGTLQTRSTKCKLLNPFELFGSSSTSYTTSWGVSVSDFTQYDYGSHYSGVFPNSITSNANRVRYHDKAMSDTCDYWTNSYCAFRSSDDYTYFFNVLTDGRCYGDVGSARGISPVIRLSDSPE